MVGRGRWWLVLSSRTTPADALSAKLQVELISRGRRKGAGRPCAGKWAGDVGCACQGGIVPSRVIAVPCTRVGLSPPLSLFLRSVCQPCLCSPVGAPSCEKDYCVSSEAGLYAASVPRGVNFHEMAWTLSKLRTAA